MRASLGRSRARRDEDAEQRVTFADVAGIDEAEEELEEIVDFLKHPERYRQLGASIPRGVLLTGPPGTGKTLLARAVAGEAGVPFFSLSASEFVEVIVGVGASRVRDLFARGEGGGAGDRLHRRARRDRPRASAGRAQRRTRRARADAQPDPHGDGRLRPGRRRDRARRDQPARVLDPALLRPGRFDRRIPCRRPTATGRQQILEVHTRSVPLADDVDLDALAAATPGMVGADLANLVNEAALLAAARARPRRPDRLHRGPREDRARHRAQGRDDRRRPRAHRLPRGRARARRHAHPGRRPGAQGLDHPARPGARRHAQHARRRPLQLLGEELLGRIQVALGGRAAEELVFGDLTTGAESDIQQLTAIARRMVGRWGMSDAVGPVFLDTDNPYGIEQRAEAVEDEVRRIVESAEDETVALLPSTG